MNTIEKVARAIHSNPDPIWTVVDWNAMHQEAQALILKQATAAITAFLEATAEKGWRIVPNEATEEMGEAWAKLALDRIQKAVEGEMRTVGMVKGAKENYRAMLAVAPKFDPLASHKGAGL